MAPDPEQADDPIGGRSRVLDRLGAIRHAGWGFTDQALSSLTNFGVGVAAARTSTAEEFGAFSVAFATYFIGAGVVRSLISDVYTVLYSGEVDPEAPPKSRYPEVGGAMGAALIIALVGSLSCLVAAAIATGDLRASFLVLAVCLPVLVMQDVARYVGITRRDAFGATLYDFAWVIGFGATLITVTVVWGFPGATTTFALWAFGAGCGFAVAVVRMRSVPNLRAGVRFVRRDWRYSARYTGDWLALGATVQFGYYLLGITAGLAVVGQLRAGMLLIGPLNIVVVGAAIITVPELSRYFRARDRSLKPVAVLTGGLVGMTLAWFAAIALLPESLLRSILGDAAADALDLLPILLIYSVITMAAQGPLVGLRATGNARRGTRASAPAAPLVLLGPSVGAWLIGDAAGSLLAWSIAGVATFVLATYQLRRALAEPQVEPHDELERLEAVELEELVESATQPEPSQLPPIVTDSDDRSLS